MSCVGHAGVQVQDEAVEAEISGQCHEDALCGRGEDGGEADGGHLSQTQDYHQQRVQSGQRQGGPGEHRDDEVLQGESNEGNQEKSPD